MDSYRNGRSTSGSSMNDSNSIVVVRLVAARVVAAVMVAVEALAASVVERKYENCTRYFDVHVGPTTRRRKRATAPWSANLSQVLYNLGKGRSFFHLL